MSSHHAAPHDSLVSGILLIAATSDLGERLDGLAREAAALVDGAAVIHLLDEDEQVLRPVAAHPVDPDDEPTLHLAGSDPIDAAALAARDRHEVVSDGVDHATAALHAVPGTTVALHLPLVLERPAESPDVEGVLTVAGGASVVAPVLESLRALATLAAVAAHQAHLESALGERADWFDRVAHTDPLTGLANRRTLDRMLELELARAARQGTELCVALFSVDGQDRLAERHGARAADDVLRRVAAALAETVRLVDMVARYGRAEFVVVAPGSTGMAMANRAAAAVRSLEPGDGGTAVSVSVGVAAFPAHGTTSEELVTAAEAALDQARRQGGAVVGAS